ncbi:MAG TPA: hypothetical protein VKY74_10045, partial [Chloroflexia bacterium]|nr:hypothetical protein [Chloroflexia bacterium]
MASNLCYTTHMIEWLLRCDAKDPEQAIKGRWLNRLLVSLITLGILSTLLSLATGQLTAVIISSVVLAGEAGITLLNRRGFVSLATGLLLAQVVLTTLGPGLLLPTLELPIAVAEPAFYALVIAIAGVFLTWRAVALLMVALSVLAIWYYIFSPVPALALERARDPSGMGSLLSTMVPLYVAIGAITWLSNRLLGETLEDLRRRNRDLQVANRELAAQERLRSELDIARDIQRR